MDIKYIDPSNVILPGKLDLSDVLSKSSGSSMALGSGRFTELLPCRSKKCKEKGMKKTSNKDNMGEFFKANNGRYRVTTTCNDCGARRSLIISSDKVPDKLRK